MKENLTFIRSKYRFCRRGKLTQSKLICQVCQSCCSKIYFTKYLDYVFFLCCLWDVCSPPASICINSLILCYYFLFALCWQNSSQQEHLQLSRPFNHIGASVPEETFFGCLSSGHFNLKKFVVYQNPFSIFQNLSGTHICQVLVVIVQLKKLWSKLVILGF